MAEIESFTVDFTVFNWNGGAFRIDVECRAKGSSFRFWDENDRQGELGRAKDIIQQMTYFAADFWEDGVFRKEFEYPSEEDDLYRYIAAFTDRFTAVVADNSGEMNALETAGHQIRTL